MLPKDTLDRILDVSAAKASIAQIPNGDPVLIIPTGYSIKNLDEFLPLKRIKETPEFYDADSFCDYVNQFKLAETKIFATVSDDGNLTVSAYIDYHQSEGAKAAYLDHTAVYHTKQTAEWEIWLSANGKRMTQIEFATWLEDNAGLVVDPASADLLEIVNSLSAKNNIRWTGSVRTQSGGVNLTFEEDLILQTGGSKTQAGGIEIPKFIIAGIIPFEGSEAYKVKARLRYKLEDRKLVLWFETIQLYAIVRDTVKQLTKKIAETTKIVPLLGSPY